MAVAAAEGADLATMGAEEEMLAKAAMAEGEAAALIAVVAEEEAEEDMAAEEEAEEAPHLPAPRIEAAAEAAQDRFDFSAYPFRA